MKAEITIPAMAEIKEQLDEILAHLTGERKQPAQTGGMELWEEITGLKPGTFYNRKHTGRVPDDLYHVVGTKHIFHRDKLEAWVQAGMPSPAQIAADEYMRARLRGDH